MVRLSRTVRFCINPPGVAPGRAHNGTGGVPTMSGIGAYYELEACCVGEPDPATGYLVDIRRIDEAVRQFAAPLIARTTRDDPTREPSTLVPLLRDAIAEQLGPDAGVASIRWNLTPTYSVETEMGMTGTAIVRQSFEIAAAHRLHADSLSEQENHRVFGRCNNPNGHGHNYRLEPAVEVDIDGAAAGWTLADIEAVTEEVLIARFDHKHLNLDTPEFGPEGVIPSVENIARVFYDLLAPAVRARSGGRARLRSMTVWETEKTSGVYPG